MKKFRAILTLCVIISLGGCGNNELERVRGLPLPVPRANIIVPIIDQKIMGEVRNKKFVIEQAIINNGTLTLRQGKEFFADISVEVITFSNKDVSGKTFSSSDSVSSLKPHVRLNIKKEGDNLPDGITLMSDYDFLLIFGEKDNLGIPFSIKLDSLKNGTSIEGKSFATYKDIQIVDGSVDIKFDSFDTLEYLAKAYIATHNIDTKLGDKFGVSYENYGKNYPKSGFVGYEVETGEPSVIKIQLAKDKNGWKVVNQLNVNQLHQAHPVIVDIEGSLRTVEGRKATTTAARRLEAYLKNQILIENVRSTSVRCTLTKTADKASCRAIYGLKVNSNVECHNKNYLLSNDGISWKFESEILDTQKVDYSSGELVSKKPFSMSC